MPEDNPPRRPAAGRPCPGSARPVDRKRRSPRWIEPPSHLLERAAIYIGAALLVFVLALLYIGRVDVGGDRSRPGRAPERTDPVQVPKHRRFSPRFAWTSATRSSRTRSSPGSPAPTRRPISRRWSAASPSARRRPCATERRSPPPPNWCRISRFWRSPPSIWRSTATLSIGCRRCASPSRRSRGWSALPISTCPGRAMSSPPGSRLSTGQSPSASPTFCACGPNSRRFEEGVRLREEQLLGIEELIDAGLSTRARALDVRDGVLAAPCRPLAAQHEAQSGCWSSRISEADLEVAELRQQLASEEDRRADQLAAALRAEAGARSAVTAFLTERQARLRDLEADIRPVPRRASLLPGSAPTR